VRLPAEVRRHGLDYSHFLDDDSAYMKALGAEGWPSMYLVDRCGRVRETQFGEEQRKPRVEGEAAGSTRGEEYTEAR